MQKYYFFLIYAKKISQRVFFLTNEVFDRFYGIHFALCFSRPLVYPWYTFGIGLYLLNHSIRLREHT